VEQSNELNELALALAKAQGKITGALKDSSNPFYKSKYADLASVWEACREHLATNGIAVVQTNGNSEERVTVTTLLVHSSGQWVRGTCSAKPAKDDAQGIGSVITYLRRYGLAAIVGVAQVDDDGEAAMGRKTETKHPVPQVTQEVVDQQKCFKAAVWFKEMIDVDNIEETYEKVQGAYARLSNNERLEVDAQLKEKAPDSNKMYKNILKEYLAYAPTESEIGSVL